LNTHIQEQVLSAHPRIIGTAAAAITENAIPLTPIKEEAVELSQIDRLKEICNNFLSKYSQELAKSSPSPKKRPKVVSNSYKSPAAFDLGIFTYSEDMDELGPYLYETQNEENSNEEEILIVRTLIETVEWTYALLLRTDIQTRKMLTHATLPHEGDLLDDDETISLRGKGFGEIYPSTLEKYLSVSVRYFLSLIRLCNNKKNNDFGFIQHVKTLQRQHHGENITNKVKLIQEKFNRFVETILFEDSTEHTVSVIAMKSLLINKRIAHDTGEPIYYEKSLRDSSFALAAVKYILTSLVLFLYWGKIDQGIDKPVAISTILRQWSKSTTFNSLNVFLQRCKSQQEPSKPRCEVVFHSNVSKAGIVFDGDQSKKVFLNSYRLATNRGVNIVRGVLMDLFKDCGIGDYFYPPTINGKDIRLTFKDSKLTFVAKLPARNDIVRSACNYAETVLNLPVTTNTLIFGDAVKNKVLDLIYTTSNVLMATANVMGDGHRRAGEYRDFHFLKTNIKIRPGQLRFLDVRRISKRATNESQSKSAHEIRHVAVISNLLVLTAHFSNAVLEHFGNKAADYVFFPLKEKPKSTLFKSAKEKFGGFETSASSYKAPKFDPMLYSEAYSNRVNEGLSKIFPLFVPEGLHITVRNLRQMHVGFQGMLKRYERNWEDFLNMQVVKEEEEERLASATGHSIRTRRIWYTAQPSRDGIKQDPETVADKFAHVILGYGPAEYQEVIEGTAEPVDEDQVVENLLQKYHGTSFAKCPEQALLIKKVYRMMRPKTAQCHVEQHVIASIKCGGGKSMAIATAIEHKTPGTLAILVVPTTVLTEQNLHDYQDKCAVKIWRGDVEDFNNTDLLITTVDKAFSTSFIDSCKRKRLKIQIVIIDEAHTLIDSAFRERLFRSEFLNELNLRTVFMSGTLPKVCADALSRKFCFRNPYEINGKLINTNIKFSVSKLERDANVVQEVSNYINNSCKNDVKILCVCDTKANADLLYDAPFEGRNSFKMHRGMDDQEATQNLQLFSVATQPSVLFATAALGEGINIMGLKHIVIVGTAYSLLKLVQYSARASRAAQDGIGCCKILYDEANINEPEALHLVPLAHQKNVEHLLTQKGFLEWCKSNQYCRRESLASAFGEDPVEPCGACDVCLENKLKQALELRQRAKNRRATPADSRSRESRVNDILRQLETKCLLCDQANCYSRQGYCITLRRKIEQLALGNLNSFKNFVRTCSMCYECWTGPSTTVKTLDAQRQKHNNQAFNGSYVCVKMPFTDTGGKPCRTCYFPHDCLPTARAEACLSSVVRTRLKNLLIYCCRVPEAAAYIEAQTGIGLVTSNTSFYDKFSNLCSLGAEEDGLAIPKSIMVVEALINRSDRNPLSNNSK
jgi:superfamily II DNA helicase RecQ